MEYDTPVDETQPLHSTPEVVRQSVLKNLRGLHRLVVEEETAKNRYSKRNAIRIMGAKLGDEPEEDDIETLCEGVLRIFDAVRSSKEGEGANEAVDFRIMYECRDKDGKRSRPSFRYTWDPDDAELDPDPDDDLFGDPRIDAFLTALQVRDLFIDKLCLRLDEAHGRIIEMAGQTSQHLKPIMDAYGLMGGMYAAGLHMQQHALALIFDTKRTDAEQKGADARHDKTLKFFEKPVSIVLKQAMAYAAKKTGVPLGEDFFEDDEEDEDEDEKTTTASAASSSPPGGAGDEEDDGLTDEDRRNPIAACCRELGNTLLGEQWFKIVDVLRTKKNMAVLRALLTPTTDKEAVAAYDKFEGLGLEVLLALREQLDDDQKEAISQLAEIVKASKDSETPKTDTGDAEAPQN